jgi:hypothetical protein
MIIDIIVYLVPVVQLYHSDYYEYIKSHNDESVFAAMLVFIGVAWLVYAMNTSIKHVSLSLPHNTIRLIALVIGIVSSILFIACIIYLKWNGH